MMDDSDERAVAKCDGDGDSNRTRARDQFCQHAPSQVQGRDCRCLGAPPTSLFPQSSCRPLKIK